MKARYFAFLAITALMVGAVGCDSKKESGEGGPGVEEAVSTATESYIYGYPLVTMDMTRRKITNVPKTAQLKVMGHMKEMGKNINGWMFFTQTGLYGTQYLDRALVTAIGLGATGLRMQFIRLRKKMRRVRSMRAGITNTWCISTRDSFRR